MFEVESHSPPLSSAISTNVNSVPRRTSPLSARRATPELPVHVLPPAVLDRELARRNDSRGAPLGAAHASHLAAESASFAFSRLLARATAPCPRIELGGAEWCSALPGGTHGRPLDAGAGATARAAFAKPGLPSRPPWPEGDFAHERRPRAGALAAAGARRARAHWCRRWGRRAETRSRPGTRRRTPRRCRKGAATSSRTSRPSCETSSTSARSPLAAVGEKAETEEDGELFRRAVDAVRRRRPASPSRHLCAPALVLHVSLHRGATGHRIWGIIDRSVKMNFFSQKLS